MTGKLTPSTREGQGLSKRLGDTGYYLTRGAHHPWDYVLWHGEVAIAGVDANFITHLRALATALDKGEQR